MIVIMVNSARSSQLILDLRDPHAVDGRQLRGTYQTGLLGEESVADALRHDGWRILGHRVRTRWGELDLICRRGDLVVFAEVKTTRKSRSVDAGEITAREPGSMMTELVGTRAQHRIRRAAVAWLAAHPALHRGARRYRFDVFLVQNSPEGGIERIDRIVNAF